MVHDYGTERTARFMTELQIIANAWLNGRGFSIGIQDCVPGHRDALHARAVVLDEAAACGTPWLDEATRTARLNNVRDKAAREVVGHGRDNAFGLMLHAGSKGSKINVAQVSVCLGQQMAAGHRIAHGLDRGLPHFCRHDSSAEARGFVANSYLTGLTPQEFWFHMTAGREGL